MKAFAEFKANIYSFRLCLEYSFKLLNKLTNLQQNFYPYFRTKLFLKLLT